jgi:hypothetical protein
MSERPSSLPSVPDIKTYIVDDPWTRVSAFLYLTYLSLVYVLPRARAVVEDPEFIRWRQHVAETRYLLVYLSSDTRYFSGLQDSVASFELKRSSVENDCEGTVPFFDFLIANYNTSLSRTYVFWVNPKPTWAASLRFHALFDPIIPMFPSREFGILDAVSKNVSLLTYRAVYQEVLRGIGMPTRFNHSGRLVRGFFFHSDIVTRRPLDQYKTIRSRLLAFNHSAELCAAVVALNWEALLTRKPSSDRL